MKLTLLLGAVFLLSGAVIAAEADLESSYTALQGAVQKNDATQVKKLAAETSTLARQAAKEEAPDTEEAKKDWETRIARAKDIDAFTEYALYATAVQSSAETTIDLIATLELQNPKSKYLEEAYAPYFVALTKTGAAAKIPVVAEKALANFPNNPDLLLILAENAQAAKRTDRAGVYGARLVAAIGKRTKPDTISAAEWERKKSTMLGRGYWYAGIAASARGDYFNADKNLRAALPLIAGNEEMVGAALFNLGVSDYQLGHQAMDRKLLTDAARFSDEVAKMKSPFARQAWTNANLIRQEIDRLSARR
jgi:hypothetical protein